MTNCNSWMNLSPEEQALMIGRLAVAVQCSEWSFAAAEKVIDTAKRQGVFERVKIGHEAVYGEKAEHGIID